MKTVNRTLSETQIAVMPFAFDERTGLTEAMPPVSINVDGEITEMGALRKAAAKCLPKGQLFTVASAVVRSTLYSLPVEKFMELATPGETVTKAVEI